MVTEGPSSKEKEDEVTNDQGKRFTMYSPSPLLFDQLNLPTFVADAASDEDRETSKGRKRKAPPASREKSTALKKVPSRGKSTQSVLLLKSSCGKIFDKAHSAKECSS